jgi:hypothetical protein
MRFLRKEIGMDATTTIEGGATTADAAMTLRSAFQIAAIWSIVLAELCYLGGPASKVYMAAATIIAAVRDERLHISELTADDITAANMVVGVCEQIWLANDAKRRIRYPNSVTDIQIVDALFVECLSENEIANDPAGRWRGRYDISLKTLQERRQRALRAIDDAFSDHCVGCDRLPHLSALYTRTEKYKKRLDGLANALTVNPLTAHIDQTITGGVPTKREWRLPDRPARSKSAYVDIWSHLNATRNRPEDKATKRQLAQVLVDKYLAAGGKITKLEAQEDNPWAWAQLSFHKPPNIPVIHQNDVENLLSSGNAYRYAVKKPMAKSLNDAPVAVDAHSEDRDAILARFVKMAA